ncbi:hypothetical protein V1478_000428, partial [Vespula squamosa]
YNLGNDEEEAINLEESVERYAIRRRPGGQQVASSSDFWSQRYQPSSSSFDRSGNNERTSARDCYVSLQIECSRIPSFRFEMNHASSRAISIIK